MASGLIVHAPEMVSVSAVLESIRARWPSPVPEIVITIILGILPIILGIAVIRIIVKNREKVVMGKRAFLFVIGILAFFLWAGFLLGPALAIAASFMPQKKNYNLRKSIH